MDVANFLYKFVNKSEDIKELISLFLQRTGCRFGALFWKKNNTIYQLIDHLSLEDKDIEGTISFVPCKLISNLYICRDGKKSCGYKCPYELRNIMIIPITVCNDSIGVICLGNKDGVPEEEDIDKLSDLISLTQLIVNKSKLIGDYKKIYSDSTYFSKDLFLANMSHEIRTPLNGIIGYNQLLANTELNDTQKSYLSCVSQCSLQLMQIINDIIDFSKLSSGNMSINNECVSMNEIFSSIEGTMKERIREKNCKFSYDISGVPDYIIIDKQKLIQIIINLISNAINYSSENGVIKVTVNNNNNKLTISVIDNGIGISEQDQCKLFNSFTLIDNSRTKTGSGLGLAICKRLVELLEGEINVKSLLGIGSTFYFTAKHKLMSEYETEIEEKMGLLSNKCILVVDSNPDNRILLGEILFDLKMFPVMCASEKEALKLVSGNKCNFELGLIDSCMNDISGEKLAVNIKKMKPLFPLIALSPINGFVDVSNFDGKINKPINKIQLFNSIYKIVKQNINDDVYIGNSSYYLSSINKNTAINSDTSFFNKNIKILIAEDILYNQTLLANMVNKIGYNDVTVVSNGEETIQKLDEAHKMKCPYVILLLDLRMPKMDGYDVITHIRNMGYPLPKIVAVTASVLDEDKSRCYDLGVQYFINKPIDMTKLKNVLLKITHIFNMS